MCLLPQGTSRRGNMAPQVKIGVYNFIENVEWAQLLQFWRFLDRETQFHSLWTSDHFVPLMAGGDMSGPCFEGWTAAAAAAQATERLRIGCVVTGITLRHPSLVAKMAATIDHVSNGRLEFGLGTAWHGAEHHTYGISFPSIKEREDMLEEAIQVIRLLFRAEGAVDFSGRYYQLRQARLSPPCVQRPHPPILIGGGGEKRTLRTAARYADASNVIGGVSTARRLMAVLNRHCAEVGRDPREISRSVIGPIYLATDESKAREVREAMAAFSGGDGAEDLAIGDAEHVRRVIERYAEVGVSHVIMVSLPPLDFDLYRRISGEIVSAFA